jgi:hypothetical protein
VTKDIRQNYKVIKKFLKNHDKKQEKNKLLLWVNRLLSKEIQALIRMMESFSKLLLPTF